VRVTLLLLLGGLAVAAVVWAATNGRLLVLPFLLVLPLGVFGLRRRGR
jgi:hypothetical protein